MASQVIRASDQECVVRVARHALCDGVLYTARTVKLNLLVALIALIALLALAACQTPLATKPEAPAVAPEAAKPTPSPAPTPAAPEQPRAPSATLQPTTWDAIPGWRDENPQLVWETFLRSCGALKQQPAWRDICTIAATLAEPDRDTVIRFFELNFTPYQTFNQDGTESGLITGYYEPLLRGSRARTARYRYPVYGIPDDLLVLDLASVYPDLKNMRLRGRLEGRRVVPYFNRAEIEQGAAAVAGKEIVWVDDPVELFFLQIQGSGRVRLESGEVIMVGYADQNGHPYRSVGRLLVDRGELPLEQASMQGIKAWARQHPDKLQEVLNYNASYVFFRERPPGLPGPLGALGIPLTPRRSIAVDPRFIPLGAPVFVVTTAPNSKQPLIRLMVAQDTGGAIRGAVRADFFWGFGEEAEREAGRMRQPLRMWVLLPNGFPLPNGS
jgi:membrane-bound lytic murein transglycosylase A